MDTIVVKPNSIPSARRLTALGATLLCAFMLSACGPSEPITEGTPPDVRRLTEEQYRNIITDIFGTSIVVGGRFDTPVREDGLLAVGARDATVTPGALIQYDEMARSIASQVVTGPNRQFLVPCSNAVDGGYDEACATQFVSTIGRMLFRRPLSDEEISTRLSIISETTDALGSFSEGLVSGLASLLVAPQFLFVTDVVEPVPDKPDEYRLTAYSIAARLSFLLWNTTPDNALLEAAEQGDLHTQQSLERQVDRMMNSPRLRAGVRAFFSDMLEFSEFAFLEKDSVIYPSFGIAAARDAKEQTLRTITDHVISQDADYRDLFTTRKTFMTRTLGLVYKVQVKAPKGVWEPYEFAEDDPRLGIQAQLSFLALNSHPGRSSPTLRGKAVRNMLLCQQVPDPPPDVDFSGFNDPNSPSKTARDRLSAHATNAACAGCHRITDPIGLALENYDGSGQFRRTENDALIDTSGDLDGIAFEDSAGLGMALRDNPAATICLVNRMYAYASGQTLPVRNAWMSYLIDSFAEDDFRVTALLKRIATSKTFYATKPATTGDRTIETASNMAQTH